MLLSKSKFSPTDPRPIASDIESKDPSDKIFAAPNTLLLEIKLLLLEFGWLSPPVTSMTEFETDIDAEPLLAYQKLVPEFVP